VPFEQQQRGMQQISRSNFSVPNRGVTSPGGGASPATHGWGHFGEPIHTSGASGAAPQSGASNGSGRFDNTRAGAPASNNFSPGARSLNGGGGAVRISPPMVQQRAPSYQAPTRSAPNYQAPRSAPSYQSPRSAPSSSGGRNNSSSGRSGSSSHEGHR
jgi:hypothetical protein